MLCAFVFFIAHLKKKISFCLFSFQFQFQLTLFTCQGNIPYSFNFKLYYYIAIFCFIKWFLINNCMSYATVEWNWLSDSLLCKKSPLEGLNAMQSAQANNEPSH